MKIKYLLGILALLLTGCAMNTGNKEIAVLETSEGNIEIELDRANAPITVENFVTYVNEGFYDGTIFHRVIQNFMIQGGGFTENGNEKETPHEPIELESKNGLKNDKYTIAMARTNDPDSATSQFFINHKNNDFLNYAPGNDGYSVFGKVIKGEEIVEKIAKVSTRTNGMFQDWPKNNIVIKKAYMK